MDYKPRDLFLSAIDIFAIFFPGAIMLYLRLDFVSHVFDNLFHIQQSGAEFWVAFIIGSYIAGQFLIALSIVLNRVDNAYRSKKVSNDPLFLYVKENIPHEKNENIDRLRSYYRAYSFIRLNNVNALAEIEKQTADYKLFRSLTLVAIIESTISLVFGQWLRFIIAVIISLFCFWRLVFLRNQTETLAFEFYYLLHLQNKETENKPKKRHLTRRALD